MVFICKMIGSFCILGACGYVAVSINGLFSQRNRELRKLYSFFLQLKSEMQYMNDTLPDCFAKLAEQEEGAIKEWLRALHNKLKEERQATFGEIWREELQHLYECSALEKSDLESLGDLTDKLGNHDTQSQIKAIDYVLIHIEECRNEMSKEMEQRKKVVATLSLFCGFMTLILLL